MDGSSWYTLLPWAGALAQRAGAQAPSSSPPPPLERGLTDSLTLIARSPVLLVATDFDGTLSPFVNDPAAAAANPRSLAALHTLASLPHTRVAVVSGRPLADLRRRLGGDLDARLVGTHGSEIEGETPQSIPPETMSMLADAALAFDRVAAEHQGCLVERKPTSVAFHYRAAPEAIAPAAVAAAGEVADRFPLLTRRLGSMVVELLIGKATKGDGLARVRRRCGSTNAIFIGDDLTDEHAFAVLSTGDVGVKVGPGSTRASHRVAGIEDVASVLERLAFERSAWLGDRRLLPINAHSLLSDQRTGALIDPKGSIVWLCLPRLDSPAIFAELLGGPGAGFFSVSPVADHNPPVQRYEGASMVLTTAWPGLCITDYLDAGFGRTFQIAGRSDLVRVIEGSEPCEIRFAPRLDFARTPTRLVPSDSGLSVEGAADPLVLYSPGVRWTITPDGPHETAVAQVDPRSGPIVLELRAGSGNTRPHPTPEPARRSATVRAWSAWAESLTLPRIATDHVRRSALLLRALVHGPSGSIAAAATTSLPEHLGGCRNWDYRACWPRDAAMAAASLVRLGNTGVAMRLLDWLVRVVDRCESPDRLRPIYAIDGGLLAPEAELGHLAGYGGSKPVRISNAAAQQVQLDVFGPIVDLIAMLAERGAPISPDHWRMTRAIVDAVASRWKEPDHGIWEIRGPRTHNIHTKAMCFATVDRGLTVHEAFLGRDNSRWIDLREQIRLDILANGYSAELGGFGSAYDRHEPDAAALCVGLLGITSPTDPRHLGTIELVLRTLTTDGLVRRYTFDDGLPGPEGAFHLCTSWLIESLVRAGRAAEALPLFERLLRCVGPTGLISEQHDPELDQSLGNTPQAYSHLALINSACAIDHATFRGEPT